MYRRSCRSRTRGRALWALPGSRLCCEFAMFSRRRNTGERYRLPSSSSLDEDPEQPEPAVDLGMAQSQPPHVAEAHVVGIYGRHLDPKRLACRREHDFLCLHLISLSSSVVNFDVEHTARHCTLCTSFVILFERSQQRVSSPITNWHISADLQYF